uniref:Uncharacterized protein n=1 Tax=Knipowitschia caucasica TaxID=637954 RepID=A0AAV2JGR8_KNICA
MKKNIETPAYPSFYSLLRDKQTSGQAVHSLRKEPTRSPHSPHEKINTSEDLEPNLTPDSFTCVLYGLPNLIVL